MHMGDLSWSLYESGLTIEITFANRLSFLQRYCMAGIVESRVIIVDIYATTLRSDD